MKFSYLSETVEIKKISETPTKGAFEIGGLYAGYGITIGNALRRVLFSSLPGAAITQIKIKNVNHEFSTLPGMVEDVVELTLNLKKIRFRALTDEPQVLTLKIKGEKEITAADIKVNAQIELINPDVPIATLTAKNAELDMELTVERGLGYSPAETRRSEKLPIGAIVLDAAFSPVVGANFVIENMRVGGRTDYNRLRVIIETDGSITPSAALRKACNILQDHFAKIAQVEVMEVNGVPLSGADGADKGKKNKRAKKLKKDEE